MKCWIKGCENTPEQGRFVDGICRPCYGMLMTGEIGHGKTFIHEAIAVRDEQIERLEYALAAVRSAIRRPDWGQESAPSGDM